MLPWRHLVLAARLGFHMPVFDRVDDKINNRLGYRIILFDQLKNYLKMTSAANLVDWTMTEALQSWGPFRGEEP